MHTRASVHSDKAVWHSKQTCLFTKGAVKDMNVNVSFKAFIDVERFLPQTCYVAFKLHQIKLRT